MQLEPVNKYALNCRASVGYPSIFCLDNIGLLARPLALALIFLALGIGLAAYFVAGEIPSASRLVSVFSTGKRTLRLLGSR